MPENTVNDSSSVPSEKTFRAYTSQQGIKYAEGRRGYHSSVYETIIDHHTSAGGELGTLLDVGCGPGTVVRELAPQFARAIGLDPAEGMIDAARSLGGASSTSEPIRFEVSTAEELGSQLSPPIADASVDLITAASAAHWFDMQGFWTAAARVLKPGGHVAIWTGKASSIHPSVPNHEKIDLVLESFRQTIVPYMTPGNLLVETMYDGLLLPWTLEKPVHDFDEADFFRKQWNPNNNGAVGEQEELFLELQTWTLDTMDKFMSTVSPVTRWREAHPDAVGTERDVVRRLCDEVGRLLHEAGVEKGEETVTTGIAGVLLMVKKKV